MKQPRKHLFLVLVVYLLVCCSVATQQVTLRLEGTKAEEEASPRVLALGAANGWTNWTAVETFSGGAWRIDACDLEGFGETMRQEGFQAALNQFDPQLRLVIRLLKPRVVVVASKGLNILTHLAIARIYTGPVVLVSPIPNNCDHIQGTTWEEQWTDSLNVLMKNGVGPIGIGVGTSADEQSLIVDIMNETQVCGNLYADAKIGPVLFEKCPDWFLRSFPGSHSWKNDASNAIHIASLINDVLAFDNGLLAMENLAKGDRQDL